MKKYSVLLVMFIICGINEVKSQVNSITKKIYYDFLTGIIYVGDHAQPLAKKYNDKPAYRLRGIYEGQSVVLMVTNINPLKYKAEANGTSQSIFDAPPAIKGPSIETFASLDVPIMPAATEKASTTDKHTEKLVTAADTLAIADKCEGVDTDKKMEMIHRINNIKAAISAIEAINTNVKGLSTIFLSFENYIKRASTLDNLSQSDFRNELDKIVTNSLKRQGAILAGASISITSNYDVNKETFEKYKEYILSGLTENENKLNDNYEALYDLVFANKDIARCVEDEFENGERYPNIDISLIHVLTNFPDTKKDFFSIREWARVSNEAVKDKLYPAIEQSVIMFEKYSSIGFELPALTLMADQDLQVINLSIKSIATDKEVRKVDKIVVHTIGGFRVDYGVGLYFSGLGDDEYVQSKKTKIDRETDIKDPQTLDSAFKSVTYSTLSKSNTLRANWGAMAFIQGRSNWGSWVNMGAYVGLGLLSNNESKPIISLGGSLIFGRVQRASLNIGWTFGRVQRLNPKYENGQEYKGDITDATVSKMSKSYLIGLHWKIGSIK